MLNETEAAASFHGLCHFFGRLSKASRAGMKAALWGCPKCHFPMLEGLLGCIRLHGQDGAVYISDLVQELHQPLPAISRTVRRMFPILPGRHTSRCRPSAAACASWNRTALFCAKRTRLTGAKRWCASRRRATPPVPGVRMHSAIILPA